MEDKLPKGVVARPNKDGTIRYYYRETWREDGKQKVRYHDLPDRYAPDFATKLEAIRRKVGAPAEKRAPAPEGTLSFVIREFRRVLPTLRNKHTSNLFAGSTMKAWNRELAAIEAEHGHRKVRDFETYHFVRIRDKLAATPGKANVRMAKWKGLMQFAADSGYAAFNPVRGIDRMQTGEFKPWPSEVIDAMLEKAPPMLRLAVISALFSGQRISDLIRMEHNWIQNGYMRVPASVKTQTPAHIRMHAIWIAEIEKVKALTADRKVSALTVLFDQHGKPFSSTIIIQHQMNYWMKKLGFVNEKGAPLYSFHGLSKNAICALAEQGLTDEEISAVVGKTPATVRYYSKETRKWMLAERAGDKVVQVNFGAASVGGKTEQA